MAPFKSMETTLEWYLGRLPELLSRGCDTLKIVHRTMELSQGWGLQQHGNGVIKEHASLHARV
jgi:hypothetical protein